MTELIPGKRRELRAAAHHLNPVVSIAGNGLTPAVLEEIDRSLQAHELIKIKIHGIERAERDVLMKTICEQLDAAAVQHIGTILVVWRQRRDDAKASAEKSDKGGARPSKAKSASAFSAAARVTAWKQAAAEKKRRVAKRSPRKPINRSQD